MGGRLSFIVEDVGVHIREEYSTFTWIMESLLEKAGFRIGTVNYDKGVLAQYSGLYPLSANSEIIQKLFDPLFVPN